MKNLIKDKKIIIENIDEKDAPLKKLINYDCFANWRVYGEVNEKVKVEVEKIEEMCQETLEKMKINSGFFN